LTYRLKDKRTFLQKLRSQYPRWRKEVISNGRPTRAID
jgi:hypothetical protein